MHTVVISVQHPGCGVNEMCAQFGILLSSTHKTTELVTEIQVLPAKLAPGDRGTSARELEDLSLVDAGLSDSQIADILILAIGTVKRHLNNIYGKLGAHNHAHARIQGLGLTLLSVNVTDEEHGV